GRCGVHRERCVPCERMPTRRKPRLRGPIAVLLPLLLLAGIWLGGHPEDLPGFMRDAFVADHATRVVDEAINRISRDYYRPLTKQQLASASISGVVASLNDRFSHYLSPGEYRAFSQPPSFTGIGVQVNGDRGGLLIARVFDA